MDSAFFNFIVGHYTIFWAVPWSQTSKFGNKYGSPGWQKHIKLQPVTLLEDRTERIPNPPSPFRNLVRPVPDPDRALKIIALEELPVERQVGDTRTTMEDEIEPRMVHHVEL